MKASQLLRVLIAVTTMLALLSCGWVGSERTTDSISLDRSQFVRISVPVEPDPKPRSTSLPVLPTMKVVSRPEGAPWLLNPIQVALRDMDAIDAIALIVEGRSMRFDLRLQDRPVVAYSSRAGDTVKDALASIVAQADWAYTVVGESIEVSDLETRTLLLLAQPGTVEAKMSVNALDSDADGGSDSSDGGTVQHVSDPYQTELEPIITQLIAADVGDGMPSTAQLLPSANALLITARPSTVRRVSALIETYNRRVSQSVRIHITVYEVTSSTEKSIGTRLQSVIANGTGAFVGGWEVRPVETDAQFVFEALNPTKRYAGSDALLEWLNREGDASINFNDSIEVRNNQIAASSSTRTYQYVSSITREQDQLGRERTEVQRNQLRTGWSISVHPTIGHDAVTVRLSLARRSLVEERPFQFGENVGTNFVTDDQVRAMTVSLADGESRIITALRASDERKTRSKLAGLVTRRGGRTANTESVLLMRVELI